MNALLKLCREHGITVTILWLKPGNGCYHFEFSRHYLDRIWRYSQNIDPEMVALIENPKDFWERLFDRAHEKLSNEHIQAAIEEHWKGGI